MISWIPSVLLLERLDGEDSLPELKGTIEEKGEYGMASATVYGFDLIGACSRKPELPLRPFVVSFEAEYPLRSILANRKNPGRATSSLAAVRLYWTEAIHPSVPHMFGKP